MTDQKPVIQQKKKGRSLRYILTLWFLIFSIIPLLLITLYSLFEFQTVFNEEQHRRLESHFKEIAISLNISEDQLRMQTQQHAKDSQLISTLSTSSTNQTEDLFKEWMDIYPISQISLFDDKGASKLILFKDANKNIQKREVLYLPSELRDELQIAEYRSFRDIYEDHIELAIYSKILVEDEIKGFIQEVRNIGKNDLNYYKEILNVDLVVLDNEYNPMIATHDDLLSQDRWFFNPKSRNFINQIRPYNLHVESIDSERNRIHLGVTTIKTTSQYTMINRISKALLTGLGVIIFFLIVIWILVSRMIVRPISNLVGATKQIESGQLGAQISIHGPKEINELIETFNNMSLRIAESIHELESANKQLQETQAQLVHSAKMVSLGQLVAGVAHELNNPIGFIYANMTHLEIYSKNLIELSDLMQKSPKKATKFKQDIDYDYLIKDLPKLIKSCQDGSQRLMDIVSGLRTFSRLDDSNLQDYHLEKNIKNTLDLLSGEIKTRIQVHLDLKDIPTIQCHAGQINQVFMNIISNAAAAIEDKGNIWITAKKEAPNIKIEIKDDGKGIDADKISHIFDPFFTTKDVGQGTGLGLSISYNIIQKHGGSITVQSEKSKGSTFVITLPLKALIKDS